MSYLVSLPIVCLFVLKNTVNINNDIRIDLKLGAVLTSYKRILKKKK